MFGFPLGREAESCRKEMMGCTFLGWVSQVDANSAFWPKPINWVVWGPEKLRYGVVLGFSHGVLQPIQYVHLSYCHLARAYFNSLGLGSSQLCHEICFLNSSRPCLWSLLTDFSGFQVVHQFSLVFHVYWLCWYITHSLKAMAWSMPLFISEKIPSIIVWHMGNLFIFC